MKRFIFGRVSLNNLTKYKMGKGDNQKSGKNVKTAPKMTAKEKKATKRAKKNNK